jgi:hypothetical protein
MSTHSVRPVWRADAPRSLHAHLNRFRDEVRPAVAALAVRHPRLADLTLSFPALAVALTHPHAAFDPAMLAALVIAGEPLAHLAAATSVPLWLKKLPPECFFGALPPLPQSADFVRRIANHLPRHRLNAKPWLEAVALGAFWGDENFAVWLAREVSRTRQRIRVLDRQQIRRMALWAWFSRRPGSRAQALIEKRFHPEMTMATAQKWARLWIESIELFVNLGDGAIADMWFRPDTVAGFTFVPLDNAAAILEEAQAMDNCLRTYGSDIAHNRARLWSVRQGGRRLATLRLSCPRNAPLPDVCELRLKRNADAPFELWLVAHQWLRTHDLRDVGSARVAWDAAPLNLAMWRAMWRPWWLEKRRLPKTLPLSPTRHLVEWL